MSTTVRPLVATTRAEFEAALEAFRRDGARIALVPTMGFLHEGHLSLVDAAASLADRVVLSIFVNPLQFGPNEDLDRYPRDLPRDLELAATRGVDAIFAPSVQEMFPDGEPRIRVSPGPLGDRLCGAARPGHFEGVLSIVARLFGIARPDLAVFGRKDAQQAALIRLMVRDLAMGVDVRTAPIAREPDGLALSSRNAYLGPDERERAPALHAALRNADEAFRAGERSGEALEEVARRRIEEAGGFGVEYVEVVDADTMERMPEAEAGHLVVVAAWLGTTRLIDNIALGGA